MKWSIICTAQGFWSFICSSYFCLPSGLCEYAVQEAKLSVNDSAHSIDAGVAAKIDKAAAELSARQKGVDLCFLVDCTGSMVCRTVIHIH